MPLYRKKPLIVEAVQWQPEIKPIDVPEWLMQEISKRPHLFDSKTGVLTLRTLGGDMQCLRGDWVIKDSKGNLDMCVGDIFEMTYELVNSNDGEQSERKEETGI